MRAVWFVLAFTNLGCADVLGLHDYASGGAASASTAASTGEGGASSTSSSSTTASTGGTGGGAGGRVDYAPLVIEDAPAVYLRLDETEGDVAMDAMGNYDGTYVGPIEKGQDGIIAGDPNLGIMMEGDGEFVELDGSLDFAAHAEFTIELWIKLGTIAPANLADKETGNTPSQGYRLSYSESFIRFQRSGRGEMNFVDANPPTVSLIHHIVARYDGTTICVFLDADAGVCKPDPLSLENTTEPLLFGQDMSGILDEVAVYPFALSDDQIKEHYAAGSR